MTDKQLRADDILAVLYSRGDGETFHWAICIPISTRSAIKLHAKDPGLGHWFFEDPPPEDDLIGSNIVCAAVKIGQLAGDFDIAAVKALLGAIPMEVPASDATIEPRFSCRVWFKEAVRRLDRAGAITCPDVYALEHECRGYARGNDASQVSYVGNLDDIFDLVIGLPSRNIRGVCIPSAPIIRPTSSRPPTDLLPHLRQLYYTDNKRSFRFIPLFIPTYLTSIDLGLMFELEHTDAHRAFCKEILSYLPEKAVHLQHLRLSSLGKVTPHDVDAFQLAQVIDICTPHIEDGMETGAASFLAPECLHSLEIPPSVSPPSVSRGYPRMTAPSPLSPTITVPSPNTFPCLTRFSTDGHTHGDIMRFLTTRKPRALRSLFVDGRDDGASFPDLCRAAGPGLTLPLPGQCGHESQQPRSDCARGLLSPVVYDHLNLTSLSLDDLPPSSLNMHMKTIVDLLRGLPSLRKLSLHTRRAHPPTLPISCLAEFAPLCAQMEELALCVETSLVPGEPAAYRTEPEGTKSLKILDAVGRVCSALKSSAFRVTRVFLQYHRSSRSMLLASLILVLMSTNPCTCPAGQISASVGPTHSVVVDFLPLMIRMRRAERWLAAGRVKE